MRGWRKVRDWCRSEHCDSQEENGCRDDEKIEVGSKTREDKASRKDVAEMQMIEENHWEFQSDE